MALRGLQRGPTNSVFSSKSETRAAEARVCFANRWELQLPRSDLLDVAVEAQMSSLQATGGLVRVRSLGCVERFFHLYASSFPVHFCLVAEIVGGVDIPSLQTALERVRRRHPALRVCISDNGSDGPAFDGIDNPIELRSSIVEADSNWSSAVEDELNRPFEPSPGPLMRATALQTSDHVLVILTFHHAIADALSGVHIINDMMRGLAGDSLGSMPLCLPVETMMGHPPSRETTAPDDAPPAVGSVITAAEKANVSVLQWGHDETDRLIRGCRANRTTVHAAICAAVSRHLSIKADGAFRLHSPMDLRQLAKIPPGHCGVFVGASVVEISATGRRSLWHDAEDVVDSLRVARSWSAVSGMLEQVAAAFPPTANKDRVAAFFASQPPTSAVVSNLGVLPLATDYTPFRLKAVWGPMMLTNPPTDRQTVGVNTFGGQLRMVHQSYRPVYSLLSAVRDDLLGSCP